MEDPALVAALSAVVGSTLTYWLCQGKLKVERDLRGHAEAHADVLKLTLKMLAGQTLDPLEAANLMAAHSERIVEQVGKAMWPSGPTATDTDDFNPLAPEQLVGVDRADDDYDDPRFSFSDDGIEPPDPRVTAEERLARMSGGAIAEPVEAELDWDAS